MRFESFEKNDYEINCFQEGIAPTRELYAILYPISYYGTTIFRGNFDKRKTLIQGNARLLFKPIKLNLMCKVNFYTSVKRKLIKILLIKNITKF